jgi:hypothetical protein
LFDLFSVIGHIAQSIDEAAPLFHFPLHHSQSVLLSNLARSRMGFAISSFCTPCGKQEIENIVCHSEDDAGL